MTWIKRNLFFVIGGVIAVALMGVGVVMLLQQISKENELSDQIGQQYAKLNELNNQTPHPGKPPIDNIAEAGKQKGILREAIGKARAYFQRISPIPDMGGARLSNADFATQLRPTIVQLNKLAEAQGVLLPKKDYYFSFESERAAMAFDTNGLEKMAVQLGEVKLISEIIFGARVFALDRIRREPVATNDTVASDFLVTQRTVSTPLSDISPFEVTFRSFSGELAQVMAQFANSPNGLIIKSISIEPAPTTGLGGMAMGDPNNPNEVVNPLPIPPPIMRPDLNPDGGRGGGGRRGFNPPPAAVTPPPGAKKDPTFLNEKPFRVTLMIMVVKPKAEAKPTK